MRIIFVGSVEFSLRALESLLAKKLQIVGICTLKQSKSNADHVDLGVLGERHGIPCYFGEDLNSEEALDWVRSKAPDIIFCFGWSKLLKQDFLNLAPMGVVGFHPAALPANRGRHPLVWALVLGLTETASTFFFMDSGADSGDILSQKEIKIDDEDDARSLYDKVTMVALAQIDEFVPMLESGSYPRIRQTQMLASSWRKRGCADGKIDWRMSATSIHNLVRGLAKPYVGAHFIANGNEIKVWRTAIVRDVPKNAEPGKVLSSVNSRPVVKCGENAVCLLSTEPEVELVVGCYL